jgi:heme-degrading monooxygenase HmoA
MILEVAILNVVAGKEKEFETAFNEAKKIISLSKGFINYQLQKCIEINNQYILLVNWQTLEDHTEGFRKSEAYKEWKKLLHHYYNPFPKVEHYSTV